MYQKLRERGWTEPELAHLQQNFWMRKEHIVLVIAGIVLLEISAVAIPYAYGLLGRALSQPLFLITLVFLAIPIGTMFGLLMVDYETLEKHHHIALLVFTPLVVIAGATAGFAHINATAPSGSFTHNALIAAVVYAFSFIAPYAGTVIYAWNSRIGSSNT